jgi:hypothetical protein
MAARYWLLIACSLSLLQAGTLRSHWIETSGPGGGRVNCLAVSSKGANDTKIFAGTQSDGVFRSTNNGNDWTRINSGFPSSYFCVYSLTASPNKAGGTDVFAGTWGSIYLSTNNGTSWRMIDNGLTAVRDIAVIPASGNTGSSTVYAATTLSFDFWNWSVYGGGISYTTNYGSTWTSINGGLMNEDVTSLAVIGGHLFAGTDYGVHRLDDSGTSWKRIGLENTSVSTLAGDDSGLFAGAINKADDWSVDIRYGHGVWGTSNNGMSWYNSFDPYVTNLDIHDLVLVSDGSGGSNLFAGTSGGVFLSTDHGKSWTPVNTGLTDIYVWSLAVSGTYLFAGAECGGIWRRPLSEMIRTGVEECHPSLPGGYSLEQNYPNPFNPSTTIEFSIPHTDYVTLKVFDMAGREVAALVSSTLTPGSHEVTFDGTDFASGAYFCRLQAGSFTQTKKLILQR